MKKFTVPTREEVSPNNQTIFDNFSKGLGMVPNLYAYFAKSETALVDYMALQNRRSTLRVREREVINMVVSQINDRRYCQSAHTMVGKINGFTDDHIVEIRGGSASFDSKLDALTIFVKEITINRGSAVENLFSAGYSEANMIDIIIVIGDKMISNFIYGATQVDIDFPVAPRLHAARTIMN